MVDSNGEKKLRGIAKDLTHEYFGNSLAVGKYFIYRRRPIKIVDGQFMGTHGLSNFWDWKEVLPSGELSKKEKSGYGGDDSIFKPTSRANAVKLAIELFRKKGGKE